MARKNESILNQIAVFPWWMILIFAATIYTILKFIVPVFSFDNIVLNAFTVVAPKFAPLISLILLIVAACSAINQFHKGKMLENQSSLDSIRNLSWREFEELVGEAFRRKGYLVLENPGEGADGGVDLRLRKEGNLTYVQCKHWKSRKVGVKIVRELYGVMVDKKVNGGIIVTFGNFTKEAREFASGKPIRLISGNQLLELISEVQSRRKISESVKSTPSCPKCGSEMKLRIAKKGKYAGQKFWGCSSFPNCRGTLTFN